ncbi:MAG: precorrin-8X methylmutase [Rhodospirillaceae bacterium]
MQSSPVIKDPVEIYQRSFAIIRAEADLSAIPPELEPLAVRLIHACGMTDLPEDLHWGGDVLGGAKAAFSQAKPVFCDVEMVARGVITAKLPGGSEPRCTLTAPETTQLANKLGTTRSAAAVELWGPALEGALVAIGNAPTALFHLIDVIKQTGVRPAVIIGMPVGFVGAAESKDLLVSEALGVPYVTVLGRRGGSAMAAAAVNALADLAAGRRGGSNP